VATERELKFSTTDEHVPSAPELQQALDGSGYAIAPGRVGRHVDTYHDAGGKLAAAGMALRLRRNASGGQRVTLKADARLTSTAMGVMHERSELELVLPETPAQTGGGVP